MPAESATWESVGTPAPTALTDARLELHWAVQIVAAVPFNYLDPAPDDSHTNLGWDSAIGWFLARPVGAAGVQAALRVHDLTLAVLVDGRVLAELPLNGRTLDAGYEWMADAVGTPLGEAARRGPLRRRDYAMPEAAVGAGAAFTAGGTAALAELGRWYANGQAVLAEVRRSDTRASTVRTWPHHFDMATLLAFDAAADPEAARSINVGLSPGDESYDEPYFYVTPWPAPGPEELPALRSDGRWHTEGFTAAVLTGSRVAVGSAGEQATRTERFLGAALEACREILGEPA